VEEKFMKKITGIVIILLFLGSSIPVFAEPHSSFPTTQPLMSASSAESYKVYLGAGFFRMYWGKFGLGWHMTVVNTGDTNISGVMNCKETTLSGKYVTGGSGSFSLMPGEIEGLSACGFFIFPPIKLINLTVMVQNLTYSKTGYEIGPFVLIRG
jgi:hypothetical protein